MPSAIVKWLEAGALLCRTFFRFIVPSEVGIARRILTLSSLGSYLQSLLDALELCNGCDCGGCMIECGWLDALSTGTHSVNPFPAVCTCWNESRGHHRDRRGYAFSTGSESICTAAINCACQARATDLSCYSALLSIIFCAEIR